jgi:hypothetical protein
LRRRGENAQMKESDKGKGARGHGNRERERLNKPQRGPLFTFLPARLTKR